MRWMAVWYSTVLYQLLLVGDGKPDIMPWLPPPLADSTRPFPPNIDPSLQSPDLPTTAPDSPEASLSTLLLYWSG